MIKNTTSLNNANVQKGEKTTIPNHNFLDLDRKNKNWVCLYLRFCVMGK